MLKLIGIAVVLSGICGWVCTWKESKDSRITNLRYMHRILTEAEYVLVREKRSIIYFFEYMGNDKSAMAKVCSDVAVLLKNHTYAAGSQAWEHAVLDRRDSLCLDKGQIHIICMAGESFFARTASALAALVLSASVSKTFRAVSKAKFNKPSPARIAMASPYTTCVVFLPLRYSSLSIAGRSSCTSE